MKTIAAVLGCIFLVYQYSTGLIAFTALAENVINKRDGQWKNDQGGDSGVSLRSLSRKEGVGESGTVPIPRSYLSFNGMMSRIFTQGMLSLTFCKECLSYQ